MSTEPGLKAVWQRLELYKSQKALPTKRCRECTAAYAPGALCLTCNDRRLELRERFQKFPTPSSAVETIEELARDVTRAAPPAAPRIDVSGPAYRLPYKDLED